MFCLHMISSTTAYVSALMAECFSDVVWRCHRVMYAMEAGVSARATDGAAAFVH